MHNRAPPDIRRARDGRIRRPGLNLEVLEMFAPEVTRAVPLGSVTTFRVVSLAQRALDAFAAWRNARATEKALRRLSDRQLADIGLHRGEIADGRRGPRARLTRLEPRRAGQPRAAAPASTHSPMRTGSSGR